MHFSVSLTSIRCTHDELCTAVSRVWKDMWVDSGVIRHPRHHRIPGFKSPHLQLSLTNNKPTDPLSLEPTAENRIAEKAKEEMGKKWNSFLFRVERDEAEPPTMAGKVWNLVVTGLALLSNGSRSLPYPYRASHAVLDWYPYFHSEIIQSRSFFR